MGASGEATLNKGGDKAKAARTSPLWLAGAVLAVGLGVTALEWWTGTQNAERETAARFGRQVHQVEETILREFRYYETALRSAAGLFAAARTVGRDDWDAFVASLGLDGHAGLLAMGYARRAPSGDDRLFRERLRREGVADFRIWPQPIGESFPIVFARPLTGPKHGPVGYDPWSEPVRRDAMERAADTGQAALSAQLTLFSDQPARRLMTGFLLVLPVYRPGTLATTPAERRAALEGFVMLVIDGAKALAGMLPAQAADDIDIEVFAGPVRRPERLIFDGDGGRLPRGRHAVELPLTIFGSAWLLTGASSAAFDSRAATTRPQVAAMTGTVVSVLLAILLWNLATVRLRAERQAAALAADSRRSEAAWRALTEQATDGIIVNDIEGRLLDVNASLCQMVGYERDELIGRSLRMLFQPEELALRPLRLTALQDGKTLVTERHMLRKDGGVVVTESTVKMLTDGRIQAIVRDIGERKRAEVRLARLSSLYRVLSETNRAILHVRDRQRLFEEICRIVVEVGGFKFAWLGVLVPDNEFLQRVASRGEPAAAMERLRISRVDENSIGRCPIATAAKSGRSAVANDLVSHPVPCCEPATGAGAIAAAGLPILCETRVVGVLGIYAGARDWFDRELMATLEEIAAEVSHALDGIVAQQRQKRAEAVLRRQAQILDQVHDAVFALDLNNVITSWNRGAEQLYGHSANQAIGQPIALLFADEALQVFESQLRGNVRQWGSVEVELESRRRGGSHLYTRLAISELRDSDGRVKGALVAASDMTRHRQVEAALRQNEAMLRAVIAGVPGMVFSLERRTDSGYAYRHVSAGVRELFGLGPEEAMAQPERLDACIVADDRAAFLAAREASAHDLAPWNWEGRIRVDGEERWIAVRAAVANVPEGVVWQGMMLNVTARKHGELEVARSREQLRQFSAYLENTREEEKATIAREVHDELGGTLTALKLDLRWLGQQPTAGEPALGHKIDDMAKLAEGALQSVRRIVSELRPTILDDLGLAAAIDWQVKEFRKRAGIAVTVHVGDPDIRLGKEQELALFRMLQESLTNIARHADASEVTIDFFVLAQQRQVVLMVSDDGCGFDAHEISRRASHGLRGMIERAARLGGEVVIDSRTGGGTTVSMHLPLAPPAGEEK